VILVTRRTASSERALAILQRARDFAPSRLVGVVRLAAGGWLDLGGKQIVAPSSDALVVAAVARPEDFRENVAVLLGREVALLAFPDHHEYRDDDIRRITTVADGRSVVMTEKDAVKLAPWASELPDAHVLTQRIVWESGRDELEMRISEAVGGLS
jgi:tetraacyldisaccharide-1-P 4'-kinase